MGYKELFIESLSDEQLGFFYAHEFNDQLAELLKDELTVKQYKLFEEWKENEASCTRSQLDCAALESLVHKQNNIIDVLSRRIDELESKLNDLEKASAYNKLTIQTEMEEMKNETDMLKKSLDDNKSKIQKEIDEVKNKTTKMERTSIEKMSGMQKAIEEVKNRTSMTTQDQMKKEMKQVVEWVTDGNSDSISTSLFISSISEQNAQIWCSVLLDELEGCTIETQKKAIGSKKTIQTILQLMNKFDSNDKLLTTCCEILQALIGCSLTTRNNVVEAKCIPIVYEIFKKNWPCRKNKEDLLNEAIWMFCLLSDFDSTRSILIEDKFLDLFLLPIDCEEFTIFDILSVQLLLKLLESPESAWKCGKSRIEIEEHILKALEKMSIGVHNPIKYSSYLWALKYLTSGTKAQKHFYAWTIANRMELKSEETCALLKEEEAAPILEKVLAEPTTDLAVKKLVILILEKLKK